jgi:dihydropteroate synthase
MYSFGCFHPKIMGILNLTPDSFYTSSFRDTNQQFSFNQYKNVDIIDIGCESSRPGANPLPEKDELDRLAGFLYYITKIEKTLSIDTYKPAVARFALENGFNMINDINGGGENGEMFEIAAEYDCPIVVMHMKGQPSNMQDHPFYDDIIEELLNYFEMKLKLAKEIGLDDEQIILDPGIGFGKRISDNDVILNRISDLKQFGYPILIGLSRKSFLCIDDDSAEDRLPATLGATAIAINNGADIIRVHDVDETYKMTAVISRILKYRNKKEHAN